MITVHFTTSPFCRVLLEKLALLVPTSRVPINHWYIGALPTLTGLAIKSTVLPAQMVVSLAVMLIEVAKVGLTTIVTTLETAGLLITHAWFEVISTVTTSLFPNEVVEKVALVPDCTATVFFFQI